MTRAAETLVFVQFSRWLRAHNLRLLRALYEVSQILRDRKHLLLMGIDRPSVTRIYERLSPLASFARKHLLLLISMAMLKNNLMQFAERIRLCVFEPSNRRIRCPKRAYQTTCDNFFDSPSPALIVFVCERNRAGEKGGHEGSIGLTTYNRYKPVLEFALRPFMSRLQYADSTLEFGSICASYEA